MTAVLSELRLWAFAKTRIYPSVTKFRAYGGEITKVARLAAVASVLARRSSRSALSVVDRLATIELVLSSAELEEPGGEAVGLRVGGFCPLWHRPLPDRRADLLLASRVVRRLE